MFKDTTAPVLSARKIVKSFPGAKVLKEVDFSVQPGEIMGLVGENGAGKSTLMKILTGVYSCDSGEIRFHNQPVAFRNAKEAQAAGISIIHQEFNLFPNLSVAENIFLDTEEVQGKWGKVRWNQVYRQSEKILESLGSDLDVRRRVEKLSVRQQQMLEIAKAMRSNAEVLIMDEPSAALPENEVQKLFDTVRLLREKGVAIIYVSHRMKEIEELCDRVTILRDGRVVEVRDMANTSIRQIVQGMVGRTLDNYYPYQPRDLGEPVLELDSLCSRNLREVSLTLRKGEILGVYGLAGSGSTELAESVFGLNRVQSGCMKLQGKAYSPPNPKAAIRNGIAYVPSDRGRQGIVAPLTIEKNTILAICTRLGKLGYISSGRSRETAQHFFQELSIRATGLNQIVGSLSGGNQQKVVLAKWLATDPKVLILNEPTRGVDIGAKADIYALMMKLAGEGIAVIMISSELPEIIGMSDRVLVMNRGCLSGEFSREGFSEDLLLSAASGKEQRQCG